MWKYSSNQFINSTDRNYKKGLILSNYHNATLEKAKINHPTDTDIDKMYTRYHPLALLLANEYAKWKQLGGVKEASTLNIEQILATLQSKMDVWQPAIEGKFVKTSPEFKAILPNGRSGLTKGNKEEKIVAVKAFSKSLENIAALATTKTAVDAFLAQIETARTAQLGSKSAVGEGSNVVANAVAACMVMQYKNLGLMMDKYADNPTLIENYFDLQTLQESTQTSFTGTLDPSENEAILVHTFTAGDQLSLKIIGDAPAKFYLSNTANGVNSELVQVAANTQITVDVTEFAVPDYHTYRYLTAVNTSNSITTKYVVEVL